MTKAEIEILREIEYYYRQVYETRSVERKKQLVNHIKKLRKELAKYREIRKC